LPVAAVLLLTVAASAVAWWLVGDLGRPTDDDFIFRWWFGERNASTIAVCGLAAALLATPPLVGLSKSIGVYVLLPTSLALLAGITVGVGLRLVTARSSGANIGGALVSVVGPFVAIALLVAAAGTVMGLLPDEEMALDAGNDDPSGQ